jgi:hypothetical protein
MATQQSNKPIKLTYDNQEVKTEIQPNLNTIFGNIKTSSIVPSGVPRKLIDQIVIYNNGTDYRLYIADLTNNTWFFTVLS